MIDYKIYYMLNSNKVELSISFASEPTWQEINDKIKETLGYFPEQVIDYVRLN